MLISSVFMILVSFFFDPSAKRANTAESAFFAAIICFFSALLSENAIPVNYHIFSNLFFAVMVLALIYVGYKARETFYVNLGILWLIIFITVKYFDFFWHLLPRSLFFISGGAVLVGTSLFLEHKRRCINIKLKEISGESGET